MHWAQDWHIHALKVLYQGKVKLSDEGRRGFERFRWTWRLYFAGGTSKKTPFLNQTLFLAGKTFKVLDALGEKFLFGESLKLREDQEDSARKGASRIRFGCLALRTMHINHF